MTPYGYSRLQGQRSIRVLELLPDRKGTPLRCHIREVSLDDPPVYDAVSYVWGPAEFVKQVYCDSKVIHITRSCSYVLHRLRGLTRPRLLWIDAISIDQKSEKERNHQVGMMADVYTNARMVLVWLGKEDHALSYDTYAMKYIRRVARRPRHNGLDRHAIRRLNYLFDKPWFHRVWTVQEFAFARNCTIICGETSVSAKDMMVFLSLIKEETFWLERLQKVYLHRAMWKYVQRTRHAQNYTNPPKCTSLLLSTQSQDSTDPRDKIFAFQGLLSLLGVPLQEPEYAKPVEQVYREAATVCMNHDSSLMVLAALTGDSDVWGLPSWVPDWSDQKPANMVAVWDEERATGSSEAVFRISGHSRLLTLRGKTIDVIKALPPANWHTYPDFQHLRSLAYDDVIHVPQKREVRLLRAWFDGFGIIDSKNHMVKFFSDFAYKAWVRTNGETSGFHTLVKYWISGIKALNALEIAEDLVFRVSTLVKEHRLPKADTIVKNVGRFHAVVRKLLDRRTMFMARSGKLGVGSRYLQEGDGIALFSGCHVPMIIRKQGSYWRLISPAYVQRTMQNCAEWTSEDYPLLDYTFA